MYNRSLKPPFVPKLSYDGDTRNFDDYPEPETWSPESQVTEIERRKFDDF